MIFRKLVITFFILLFLLLAIDIFIRIFYCGSAHLSFNSQEFNNILSPIISLFGFVGVIITILLTLKQLRHQQGGSYFDYYREFINKIANENTANNKDIMFSTNELLDFAIYAWSKMDDLKKHPEYFEDLNKFKKGESVNSQGKPYDQILGNVRAFAASLSILLKKYKSLINEIDTQQNLDASQKNLLLKDLIDSQLEKYYYGCMLLDTDEELKESKNNLYMGFAPFMKDQLLVFNAQFYELRNIIDSRPDLKKIVLPSL